MHIVSVGYQGRSLDSLCDALEQAGVGVLIDVRALAWSQRPEFRKGVLSAAVERRRIRYVHCKMAGNPFRPKRGEVVDLAACEEAYEGYLASNPEVLDEIESHACGSPTALLCYEAHRDDCHRGVLIKALKRRQRGIRVFDL